MALTDENGGNGMVMPVAPMYGGGYGNNNGSNGWGGDWAWIILLLLLGWGNNGFGNNAGMLYGGAGGNTLYPWMNQAEITTQGFQNQLLNDNITSIRDGVGNLSTQLCNGFNGVGMQMANNTIADLERSFAAQTANTQGLNNLSSQLANCCCENRAATADVKYTIATEACNTRANATANTQAILDKLCQLELDGYKRENDNLRTQLSDAKIAASQTAQNAFISQGFANEVDALYNRLNSCPVPTTPVYGRTPIFTCNNNGCGCGCGNGSF